MNKEITELGGNIRNTYRTGKMLWQCVIVQLASTI